MRVTFSLNARNDLMGIGDHIARESPRRALAFVRKLRQQAEKLEDQPLAFPFVRRYEHLGLRRLVFRGCLIFYRVEADDIFIIRILHGARDYEAVLASER